METNSDSLKTSHNGNSSFPSQTPFLPSSCVRTILLGRRVLALLCASMIGVQSNCVAWAADNQILAEYKSKEAAARNAAAVAEDGPSQIVLDSATITTPIGTEQPPVKVAVAGLPAATPASDDATLKAQIESTDPQMAMSRADELTRQIILKLIELERFNLHFKQNVGKQGRWKGWRYAVFQEANFGLNMAGGINNVGERGQHLHRPSGVSVNRVGMGNAICMIGSIIGASGAAIEFWINQYHDWEAARKGFSPRAARKHVLELKDQIDKLMAERALMVRIEKSAPLLTAHAEIDDAEGRVLKDMRDLGLLEYSKFHIGQRRFMAFQQSLYFFDLAKYSTSAIGSFFAYMSLHKHRRVWNNRAGVLFDISGALTIAAPLASRGIGILAGKFHKHLISDISKDVETREIAQLEKDEAILEQLCKGGRCPADSVAAAVERAEVYNKSSMGFQNELQSSLAANRKAKLVAQQNIASGLFVGGTKIAAGSLFNVVGKRYNTNSALSGRVTNYDLFVAGILGVVGSGVSFADTLRLQVRGEIARHKLAKQGRLPGQLINTRLKQLDEMEQRLKTSAKVVPPKS